MCTVIWYYYKTKQLKATYSLRSSRLDLFCKKKDEHRRSTVSKIVSVQKQPPEVFYKKKNVLKNFETFTGKHMCLSLFFNKVSGLSPAILLKKTLQHRCFTVNFAKYFRTPIFKNICKRLLLFV